MVGHALSHSRSALTQYSRVTLSCRTALVAAKEPFEEEVVRKYCKTTCRTTARGALDDPMQPPEISCETTCKETSHAFKSPLPTAEQPPTVEEVKSLSDPDLINAWKKSRVKESEGPWPTDPMEQVNLAKKWSHEVSPFCYLCFGYIVLGHKITRPLILFGVLSQHFYCVCASYFSAHVWCDVPERSDRRKDGRGGHRAAHLGL